MSRGLYKADSGMLIHTSIQILYIGLAGKITLYWNRKGWFLIFISIVDKNIKFTTTCSWSKYQLFLIKVSTLKIMMVSTYNLRKMSHLTKKSNLTKESKLTKKSNFRRKSNVKETSNLRKMYNFRYILHLPFRLQILWI